MFGLPVEIPHPYFFFFKHIEIWVKLIIHQYTLKLKSKKEKVLEERQEKTLHSGQVGGNLQLVCKGGSRGTWKNTLGQATHRRRLRMKEPRSASSCSGPGPGWGITVTTSARRKFSPEARRVHEAMSLKQNNRKLGNSK